MSKFTLAQQRALAILPKITGSLSFLFSLLIATTILRDGSRRKLCYHRLLLGISCADMSASLWMLLSTWPIPRDSGVVYAVGNHASCTAQGFFLTIGVIGAPFFNVVLSYFYLLMVNFNWKDHQVHKIEWPVQVGVWTLILAMSIIPIPLEMYNNWFDVCTINGYPVECLDSYRYGDEADCTRGDNAWIFSAALETSKCARMNGMWLWDKRVERSPA